MRLCRSVRLIRLFSTELNHSIYSQVDRMLHHSSKELDLTHEQIVRQMEASLPQDPQQVFICLKVCAKQQIPQSIVNSLETIDYSSATWSTFLQIYLMVGQCLIIKPWKNISNEMLNRLNDMLKGGKPLPIKQLLSLLELRYNLQESNSLVFLDGRLPKVLCDSVCYWLINGRTIDPQQLSSLILYVNSLEYMLKMLHSQADKLTKAISYITPYILQRFGTLSQKQVTDYLESLTFCNHPSRLNEFLTYLNRKLQQGIIPSRYEFYLKLLLLDHKGYRNSRRHLLSLKVIKTISQLIATKINDISEAEKFIKILQDYTFIDSSSIVKSLRQSKQVCVLEYLSMRGEQVDEVTDEPRSALAANKLDLLRDQAQKNPIGVAESICLSILRQTTQFREIANIIVDGLAQRQLTPRLLRLCLALTNENNWEKVKKIMLKFEDKKKLQRLVLGKTLISNYNAFTLKLIYEVLKELKKPAWMYCQDLANNLLLVSAFYRLNEQKMFNELLIGGNIGDITKIYMFVVMNGIDSGKDLQKIIMANPQYSKTRPVFSYFQMKKT